MPNLSQEWIQKAEGDYTTAMREYRARTSPNYDAACFHAQQCIEKYLKAQLLEDKVAFQRIHDLEVLLDLALENTRYGRPCASMRNCSPSMRFNSDIPEKALTKRKPGMLLLR